MEIDFTHKVLVVEDEALDRLAVVKMLEKKFSPYHILQAIDGVFGLHLFQEHSPDVILTDIRMPNMDGVEMIEEIRKINSSVPIIVISAFEKELFRLDETQISEYILKPLTMTKLYSAIERAI